MLHPTAIEAIVTGTHGDPFGVLGLHADDKGAWWLRAWLPGAKRCDVIEHDSAKTLGTLELRHAAGFFEGKLAHADSKLALRGPRPYRLRVTWADYTTADTTADTTANTTADITHDIEDPYRFGMVLGEMDVWLLGEGSHLRPFEILGANPRTIDGVAGTGFAVWAPNASRVSIVGDFNQWDGRRHPMRLRRECGVWELFLPNVGEGAAYKFELLDRDGRMLPLKADPYARRFELRPATASIVAPMPEVIGPSPERQRANALDAPVSIYEVHLGSWRRRPEDGDRWLTWDELADQLVVYAAHMGFTHLEFMPVSEHPFDGSWGYQTLGLFAPTARFGDPQGFRRLVQRAHDAGIGVILDWVPAHFPTDAHGLAQFDGTHLYEYADPREGFHNDWNTLIYNFGRTEVRNFLVGNALYWLERWNVDGLRVDAVASMLYRDYSRKEGEWVPNIHGGRENLEAISFLRRANEVVGTERSQAITLAEESTAFPAVSRPPWLGGLGFHYKWNMGWMHDTLKYMARDAVHRPWHHGDMTFGLVYAFNENFVLPISHDEVVHGKGSLLAKMSGDRWQKLANLRAYFGFMWAHPGKKLLFMGCEFGQEREWNHDASLDWHLCEQPEHAGVQRLVRDLNHLYRDTPALWQRDFSHEGFEWIDHEDAQHSILSFVRRGQSKDKLVLVISNFAPVVREGFRVGVPEAGTWHERLNTDSQHYGGSNVGTPGGAADSDATPSHGRAQSIIVTVPPLATVYFAWSR